MFKFFVFSLFIIAASSCNRSPNKDLNVIEYKEKSVSQSKFVKSLLHQGFLLYGKNLVLNLKDEDTFEKLKQKALEIELESLFIQSIADKNGIIIKDEELKTWIEARTKGLSAEELEYFLNYSNMSMKEWKSLFKDQLLKEKVLELYVSSKNDPEVNSKSSETKKIKHYQIATLTFDSTIEAQNVYKELKAFPKRIDDLLRVRKGTNTYDWITESDEILYKKIKNLRKGGLTKPFETPWGHMVVKFFKSEKREPYTPNIKPAELRPIKDYSKDLMAFNENKDLKIRLKTIYGLELK